MSYQRLLQTAGSSSMFQMCTFILCCRDLCCGSPPAERVWAYSIMLRSYTWFSCFSHKELELEFSVCRMYIDWRVCFGWAAIKTSGKQVTLKFSSKSVQKWSKMLAMRKELKTLFKNDLGGRGGELGEVGLLKNLNSERQHFCPGQVLLPRPCQ